MFRMASPWGGWGYGPHPDDDDSLSFPFQAFSSPAAPQHNIRSFIPMEDMFFEAPRTYAQPAYRANRQPPPPVPHPAAAAFVPINARRPRERPVFATPAAAEPYASMINPYGFPYARRPAPPAAPYTAAGYPRATPRHVTRGHPLFYGDLCDTTNPVDDSDEDVEAASYFSHRLRQQDAARTQRRAPGAGASSRHHKDGPEDETQGRMDVDDNRNHAGSGTDTSDGSEAEQQEAMWFFDPRSGLCFRAATTAAAPTNKTSNPTSAASAVAAAASQPPKSRGKVASQQPAACSLPPSTPQPRGPAPTARPAHPGAAQRPVAAAGTRAPAPAAPTRIHVLTADAAAADTRVPVTTINNTNTNNADASSNDKASASRPRKPNSSLERQDSTAIVTRPPMEVTLSRGPSANLPTASASASTTTAAAAASAAAATVTAAAFKAAAAAGAAPPPAASFWKPMREGPFATASTATAAFPPRMTRSQAARTVQRWWRGWRLWRHSAALKELVSIAAAVRAASARFYLYMGATSANITNKQHLEINEMAMKAILKLDSMEGMPSEFRALRKHLTARALRLQDEVLAAYTKSEARPALARAASEEAAAAAAGAAAAPPPAHEIPAEEAAGASTVPAAAAAVGAAAVSDVAGAEGNPGGPGSTAIDAGSEGNSGSPGSTAVDSVAKLEDGNDDNNDGDDNNDDKGDGAPVAGAVDVIPAPDEVDAVPAADAAVSSPEAPVAGSSPARADFDAAATAATAFASSLLTAGSGTLATLDALEVHPDAQSPPPPPSSPSSSSSSTLPREESTSSQSRQLRLSRRPLQARARRLLLMLRRSAGKEALTAAARELSRGGGGSRRTASGAVVAATAQKE